MSTKDSDIMANIIASPTVANDVGVAGGRLRVVADAFEVATTDIDAGDIIRLCRLPVKARLYAIHVFVDDLDSGSGALTMELGLYKTDGTVLDIDCYNTAAAWSAASTNTTWYNWRYGGGAEGVLDDTGQMLYEDAGLSAVPSYGEMDLCITIETVADTAAAGTVAFQVWYVID